MKTTVQQQTDEQFDADTIHVTKDDEHGDAPEMRVYVFAVGDDVPVVQIDTDKGFGEFRIAVNDQHYVIHDTRK